MTDGTCEIDPNISIKCPAPSNGFGAVIKESREERIFYCTKCDLNFKSLATPSAPDAECTYCTAVCLPVTPTHPGNPIPAKFCRTPSPISTKSTKDKTKTPFTLLQFDFLAAMAYHMLQGLKLGRERDDWCRLDWTPETRNHYKDALLRHALEKFDPVAIACNCMIIWYNDRTKGKK